MKGKKKAKNRNKNKSTKLIILKNKIRRSKNARIVILKERKSLPVSAYKEFIDWITSNYPQLLSKDFPSSYDEIFKGAPNSTLALNEQLHWSTARFSYHINEINKYLELKDIYIKSLLNDKYDECNRTLNKIEQELGTSLWLLEARISLIQQSAGLEEQKDFSKSIIENNNNTLASYAAYYFSERNEPTTIPFRFVTKTNININKLEIEKEFQDFLKHMVNKKFFDIDATNTSSLLSIYEICSTIDHYESFIDSLIELCISSNNKKEIRESITSSLNTITGINDHRINRLNQICNNSFSANDFKTEDKTTFQDKFYRGSYEDSIESAYDNLKNDPADTHAISTLANIYSFSPNISDEKQTLKIRITNLLADCYSGNEAADASLTELVKLTQNFWSLDFSYLIHSRVYDILSEEIPTHNFTRSYELFSSKLLSPSDLAILNDSVYSKVRGELSVTKNNEAIFEWVDIAFTNKRSSNNLSIESEATANGNYLYSQDNHTELKNLYNSSSWKLEGIFNLDFIRILTTSFIENDEFDEFIIETTRTCIKHDFFRQVLPVNKALQNKSWKEIKKYNNLLSLPILLNIASKSFDNNDYDSYLRYAYEDFLFAHGVKKPSELRGIIDNFDKNQIIYYLKEICVQNIMEASFRVFRDPELIPKERIDTLILLMEIDENNSSIYQDEIISISTKLKISEGIKYIDQNRIYIDKSGVLNYCKREYKELFKRYKQFVDAGLGEFNDNVSDIIIDHVKAKKSLPDNLFEIPSDEVSNILIDLVKKVFHELLSNKKHGLNWYLSMRVRHGSMEGFLRGPLENNGIIYNIDSSSKKYKSSSDSIINKLSISEKEKLELNQYLINFSTEYDNTVISFINEFLQIKSEDKPNGLIDLTIQPFQLHILHESIKKGISFDDFLDQCNETFWHQLEPILTAIKHAINNNLKLSIEALFEKLESDTNKLLTNLNKEDLVIKIRDSSTSIQREFSVVTEWFTQRDDSESDKYSLDLALDITLETYARMHNNFSPSINRKLDCNPVLNKDALQIVTDILFITLDNIYKRAGNKINPSIDMQFSYDKNENLKISIKNNIENNVDISENIRRLDNIRERIKNNLYRENIDKEGGTGTGIIKIKNIVDADNTRKDAVEFGIQNNQYHIDITIITLELEK